MKVQVAWQGKRQFTAEGESHHRLVMDANKEAGGENGGARPLELLLAGLGGCTGIDVVSILEKMRLPLEDLRIEIDGKRAERDPKRFTQIHLRYVLAGPDLPKLKVERAIRLSLEKYCSAAQSLRAEITASYVLGGQEHLVALDEEVEQ